ncbi:hypothetical protein Drorol1_Dr00003648, partial [Drosera rotundifolia]
MKELHPMDQSKSMEQGSSQPHQRPTSTQQPKRGFWPIIHQCRAAHAEEKEKTQLGEQEKKKKKKPSLEKRSHAQQFKRKKKGRSRRNWIGKINAARGRKSQREWGRKRRERSHWGKIQRTQTESADHGSFVLF